MRRSGFTRFVAPAAFLAAVTIGVLLVRAGFEQGRHRSTTPTTTLTATTRRHVHHRPHRRTYIVQSNDTFDSIARKTGTSVTRLEQLNPTVDPTALRVGEKIRVE